MQNIKLTIQYDGSKYHGWQRQLNGISVQQVIEEGILKITQEKPKLNASGRTDAGVHALSQVANFKTSSSIDPIKIQKGLNSILPKDIVVLSSERVPLDFKSNIQAKRKLYRYYIYNSQIPDAFSYKYAKYIPYFLNVDSMKMAAKHLLGTHDFSAFRSASCEAKTTTRTILSVEVSQKFSDNCKNTAVKPTFEPCQISLDVLGNGFLKNMVRNIAGTLIEVGKGKFAPEDMKTILDSKDRSKAGPTASPYGLFLVKVFYN